VTYDAAKYAGEGIVVQSAKGKVPLMFFEGRWTVEEVKGYLRRTTEDDDEVYHEEDYEFTTGVSHMKLSRPPKRKKNPELTPEEEQWVKDLLAGKFDDQPIPKLTCVGCGEQFEMDMETLVCSICKKPICHKCDDDLSKMIHHDEQRVRFYDLMENE
jgi:hypothetical protein